jgi:hypothetical protein
MPRVAFGLFNIYLHNFEHPGGMPLRERPALPHLPFEYLHRLEPVMGHRWLAFGFQGVCILAVQQPERHAGLPELPVDRTPVGVVIDAFGPVRLLREEPRTGLALVHAFCILLGDPLPLCRLGDSLDAVLRHPERPCDRVAGCPCGQLLQYQPGLDLPCHAFLLRLVGTWQEETISRTQGQLPAFSRRCRSAIIG